MYITPLFRTFTCLLLGNIVFFNLITQLKASLPESLAIEVKNIVHWNTTSGQSYQLQKSTIANSWENVAITGESSGNQLQQEISALEPGTEYRVVKTINGYDNLGFLG